MNIIPLTAFQVVYINLEGYFFNRLENVILSCSENTLLPYLCTYSFLTNNSRLSSTYPTVSGFPLDTYFIAGENGLSVHVSVSSQINALYDLIFKNEAGYSKLSDKGYLINGGIISYPNDNNMPFITTTTFGESGVASVVNLNNIIVVS
jgi:hypothetical protein